MRLTLMGMMNYDRSLLQGLDLPEAIDAEDLETEILVKCGDLYPYIQDIPFFDRATRNWFHRRKSEFQRMIDAIIAEYNPIHNYDRYEHWADKAQDSRTTNTEGTSDSTGSSKSNTSDTVHAGSTARAATNAENGSETSYSENNSLETENRRDLATDTLTNATGHMDGKCGKDYQSQVYVTLTGSDGRNNNSATTLDGSTGGSETTAHWGAAHKDGNETGSSENHVVNTVKYEPGVTETEAHYGDDQLKTEKNEWQETNNNNDRTETGKVVETDDKYTNSEEHKVSAFDSNVYSPDTQDTNDYGERRKTTDYGTGSTSHKIHDEGGSTVHNTADNTDTTTYGHKIDKTKSGEDNTTNDTRENGGTGKSYTEKSGDEYSDTKTTSGTENSTTIVTGSEEGHKTEQTDTTTTGTENTATEENTTSEEHVQGKESEHTSGSEHGSKDGGTRETGKSTTATEESSNSTTESAGTASGETSSHGETTGSERTDGSQQSHHDGHMFGNIGVTTNQQMIAAELELRKFDIYEWIAREFEAKFMVRCY